MTGLDLSLIHPALRARAVAALDAGNVEHFLIKAEHGNQHHLEIVLHNMLALQERGLYERALLAAWSGCRMNYSGWPTDTLRWMFGQAERDRLRACGEPLPGSGPFTLYRGVAGTGRRRRVRGFSWTDDRNKAAWFAARLPGLADRAIYTTAVTDAAVLAYLDAGEYGRNEREFIIMPPHRMERVPLKVAEAVTA